MIKYLFVLFIFCFINNQSVSQSSLPDPLLEISMLQYLGAFRMSAENFGASSLSYSEGPIVYNPDNHSLFIVGHAHHQEIAEFAIPQLSIDENMGNLNMVSTPIQPFANSIYKEDIDNEEGLNRIGGLFYFGGTAPKLIVNAYEYYDAPADNVTSTIVLNDPSNIETSTASGAYHLIDNAAHVAGWISSVPEPYATMLGGSYLFGNSSGIPIIGRASVGPSAFITNLIDFDTPDYSISMSDPILDFSLNDPLHSDLSNDSLDNDIWTHLSRAIYGFIVPGTRTYFTIGYSGGHVSGVCYKCTQSDGNLCGGYCTPDAADNYNYYWLWNMDDLIEVYNENIEPHEVRPYEKGEFNTQFGSANHSIIGATFDSNTSQLYLNIGLVDTLQGAYSYSPIIEVYQLPQSLTTNISTDLSGIEIFPNPAKNLLIIQGLLDDYTLKIVNNVGQTIFTKDISGQQEVINLQDYPSELLFLQLYHNTQEKLFIQKIVKVN